MNGEQCRHCGRTSHGFVCCGLWESETGEPCRIDHFAEPGPTPAPTCGQSGPPRTLRAPRRINPRGIR